MKSKSCTEINMLLKQLRECLEDILPSNPKFGNNFFLYRWLITNHMQIDLTEKAIRKSIEWRRTVNLEELAEKEWAYFAPGLENDIFMHFEGNSKTGQPVSTLIAEEFDGRALIQKYGKPALLRYFTQYLAKLEKRLFDHYKNGPTLPSDNQTLDSHDPSLNLNPEYNPSWDSAVGIHIASYKDFPLRNLACFDGLQLFLEGAKIGMIYFPVCVSTFYIVNFNKCCSIPFNLLKPIIISDVFNVEVFGPDKSKWSKELLSHIDADQLPTYFGGTKFVHRGPAK